jgi:cytochrome c-type biogenesis protein
MTDILSTFLLGLVIIIHPCTAAPNIAAMTYIQGKSDGRKRVLWMYILGHSLLYAVLGTAVAWLVRTGIITLSHHTEATWVAPLLATVFSLGGIYLVVSSLFTHHHHEVASRNLMPGVWGAFVSGTVIALAFCPEAAVAFFGVLVPLSATAHAGLALPTVFAIATALPLAVLAVLLQRGTRLSLGYLAKMKWFNLVLGILFLATAVVIVVF